MSKKRNSEIKRWKKKSARTRLSKPSALFIPISQVEATTTAASPSSSTYVLIFMIDHRPARHFLAYCSFFSRLFRFFSPFLAFSRSFLDFPAHFLVFYRLFSPFRAFFSRRLVLLCYFSLFLAVSRISSLSLAISHISSRFSSYFSAMRPCVAVLHDKKRLHDWEKWRRIKIDVTDPERKRKRGDKGHINSRYPGNMSAKVRQRNGLRSSNVRSDYQIISMRCSNQRDRLALLAIYIPRMIISL